MVRNSSGIQREAERAGERSREREREREILRKFVVFRLGVQHLVSFFFCCFSFFNFFIPDTVIRSGEGVCPSTSHLFDNLGVSGESLFFCRRQRYFTASGFPLQQPHRLQNMCCNYKFRYLEQARQQLRSSCLYNTQTNTLSILSS